MKRGQKYPTIVDIHPEDCFYNDRERFIGKRITSNPRTYFSKRDDGFVGIGKATVSGKRFSFYKIKLDFIPEKWKEF